MRELDPGVHVMAVLQGFEPAEYARHTEALSPDLPEGARVGVGSVCRRQGRPVEMARVLSAILNVRPDLKLHEFGVKTTAFGDASVALRLHTVDSMAWSLAARWESYRDDPGARNSLKICQKCPAARGGNYSQGSSNSAIVPPAVAAINIIFDVSRMFHNDS